MHSMTLWYVYVHVCYLACIYILRGSHCTSGTDMYDCVNGTCIYICNH